MFSNVNGVLFSPLCIIYPLTYFFQGPEPESLAIAKLLDYTLIMVGNERPGVISIYSIDNNKSILKPKFTTLISDFRSTTGSWQEIYDNRQASMIDPEDLL